MGNLRFNLYYLMPLFIAFSVVPTSACDLGAKLSMRSMFYIEIIDDNLTPFDSVITATFKEERRSSHYIFRPIIRFQSLVENIKKIHKNEVGKNIPESDCEKRYKDNNDYSLYPDSEGKLIGTSTITYSKWTCDQISYPCQGDAWFGDIDTCTKTIETKLYTHTIHPEFAIEVKGKIKNNKYILTIDVKGNNKFAEDIRNTVSKQIPKFEIPNTIEIEKHDVRFVSKNGKLHISGEMKANATRQGEACQRQEKLLKVGFKFPPKSMQEQQERAAAHRRGTALGGTRRKGASK